MLGVMEPNKSFQVRPRDADERERLIISIMRGLTEVREMEKTKEEYNNVVLTLKVPGFEDFHYVQPMTQGEIDVIYDEKDLTYLCDLFFTASRFIKNNRANLLLRKGE